MSTPLVHLHVEDRIATITITRPKALNALNAAVINALHKHVVDLDGRDDVRVVLLTGEGQKSFVAGADIAEFANHNQQEGQALAQRGQDLLFTRIANAKKIYIAAINGFALGGGLELALSCHVRVASDKAKMGLPEVSLGVIPGYGGTQRLANLVGKGKAMEMITTAGMLSANEAKDWGLVNYVCSQEELIAMAEKIASKIKRNSPMAIAKAIKSVNAGFIAGVDGFEVEKKEFGNCFGTSEFIEGTTAFMEKRKPSF
jgi:enoyl-CoA hydratase